MSFAAGKLSAFGKTGDTKAEMKYPEITELALSKKATEFLINLTKAKALATLIDADKAELSAAAKKKWLEHNQTPGAEYSTSVVIVTDRTKIANNVIVTHTEGYQVKEKKDEITDIIGPILFKEHFDDVFSLSIDSTKIPVPSQDAFVDGLIELCLKHGVDPGEAVKAKHGVKPKAGFNPIRMRDLTPEKNLELDAIYPVPASVSEHKKTKGDESKVRAPKK